MTRRNWFVLAVLLLFLVLSLWVVGSMRTSNSASARGLAVPTASMSEATVTAKGSIVPARYARLSFGTGGMLAQILVKEGDRVKTGDTLAQLETGDLKLQLQSAQDSLDIANATLAQLKTGGVPEEIAAAEANLRNAQAQYDRAKNGPGESDLFILKANLSKAEAALQTAQSAYDRVGGASNPSIGMLPQSLALQQATQDYAIAKANYELKTKADAATLAAAEAAVHNAQAALDLKRNGARPSDLAVNEARVRQAKTALAQAQAVLAKTTLVAPFDGTITSLVLRQGEMISTGSPVITLADLTQLRVETSDLDEWGAAKVQVGQTARVIVNAFTSKTLTGRVVSISPQSTTLSNGDISYAVTIALDQQDPEVRWGMTTKVEFQPMPRQ